MNAGTSTIAANCRCTLTTIAKKQIVALTGVGLALFMFIHMAENMLIFLGPEAYNKYVRALNSLPIIYLAELGLLAFFIGHAFYASFLTWRNYNARPQRYAVTPNGEKRTAWIHRMLIAQGLLLLVFLILHLITFKYGTYYSVNYGQGEMRDIFRLVNEVFHQPIYVVWYLVALVVLGMHLAHGVKSTLQSFGIFHPRYEKALKCVGFIYALVVALGFISQPIYLYAFYKG